MSNLGSTIDELDSAEAALDVLQRVLQNIVADDMSKQTPCREFDVAQLTDHVMNSIAYVGGAVGAQLPRRETDDPVDRQILLAAQPVLAAWRRRGLAGAVQVGQRESPATAIAGILSLEFLVHAWDYAMATGQAVDVPDALANYVMGLTQQILTPQARNTVGFDDPVPVVEDAPAFDRLIAFTGRRR